MDDLEIFDIDPEPEDQGSPEENSPAGSDLGIDGLEEFEAPEVGVSGEDNEIDFDEEISLDLEPAEEISLDLEPATAEEISFGVELEPAGEISLELEPATAEEISLDVELELAEEISLELEPATAEEIDLDVEPEQDEEISLDLEIEAEISPNIEPDLEIDMELGADDIEVSDVSAATLEAAVQSPGNNQPAAIPVQPAPDLEHSSDRFLGEFVNTVGSEEDVDEEELKLLEALDSESKPASEDTAASPAPSAPPPPQRIVREIKIPDSIMKSVQEVLREVAPGVIRDVMKEEMAKIRKAENG